MPFRKRYRRNGADCVRKGTEIDGYRLLGLALSSGKFRSSPVRFGFVNGPSGR